MTDTIHSRSAEPIQWTEVVPGTIGDNDFVIPADAKRPEVTWDPSYQCWRLDGSDVTLDEQEFLTNPDFLLIGAEAALKAKATRHS